MNRRYGLFNSDQTAEGGFYGPPRCRDNVFSTEFISGEDSAFGINIGASINPNDKFRIGASYRQGPKFDIAYHRDDFTGTLQCDLHNSEFKVPDVIAVGVLVKPIDALNVTVDFRRVQYSQLISEMGLGFSVAGVTVDDYGSTTATSSAPPADLFTNLSAPLSAIAIRGGVGTTPITASATKACSRATACSFSRATAKCTTPSAAAWCSRRRSSTSDSTAPRR